MYAKLYDIPVTVIRLFWPHGPGQKAGVFFVHLPGHQGSVKARRLSDLERVCHRRGMTPGVAISSRWPLRPCAGVFAWRAHSGPPSGTSEKHPSSARVHKTAGAARREQESRCAGF